MERSLDDIVNFFSKLERLSDDELKFFSKLEKPLDDRVKEMFHAISKLSFETCGTAQIHLSSDEYVFLFPSIYTYGTIDSVNKHGTYNMPFGNTIRFHSHSDVKSHWQPPTIDDIELVAGRFDNPGKFEIIVTGAGMYILYLQKILPIPNPKELFEEIIRLEHQHTEDSHKSLMILYKKIGRIDFFPWESTVKIKLL